MINRAEREAKATRELHGFRAESVQRKENNNMLHVGDKLICKANGEPETEFCIRGKVKKIDGDIVTISRALKFGTLPINKDLTLPESELLKYYTLWEE